MRAWLSQFVGRGLALARALGPYAAIELLLPGGSVVALLYWWYRHTVRPSPETARRALALEARPVAAACRCGDARVRCLP